jgi:hypothetical protein
MDEAFSTATTATFGRKQAPMLHLFATINNALRPTFWRALCMTFRLGFTCYPQRLSAQIYGVFLEEELPEMLEEIPLALRRIMWLHHDGAAAHFTRQVREHLTATYGDRWIERGGPVVWTTRSPDLTLMEFFLCGHIKNLIFTSPVDSEDDLIARTFKAAATITQQPGNF